MPEPSPTTIMKDTNTQPKVGVCCCEDAGFTHQYTFCHHAADLRGDVDGLCPVHFPLSLHIPIPPRDVEMVQTMHHMCMINN